MTDLTQFSAWWSDEATPVELKDPAGKPIPGDDGKPIEIRLLSPDCSKLQARRDEIRRAHRETHKGKDELTDAEVSRFVSASLAVVIDGWSSNFVVEGERLEYSEENAVRLVEAIPLVKQQVADWIGDRGKTWAVLSKRAALGGAGEAVSIEKAPAKKQSARSSVSSPRAKARSRKRQEKT